MAKRKMQATVRVADGAGGMVSVDDLRFATGEWPIRVEVPADRADHWMAHLVAECSERHWLWHGGDELEVEANSGSLVVSTGGAGQSPALEIVWERPRRGPITVQARSVGTPALSSEAAQEFFTPSRSGPWLGQRYAVTAGDICITKDYRGAASFGLERTSGSALLPGTMRRR